MKNFFKNKHIYLVIALILFIIARLLSSYNQNSTATLHQFKKTLQKKEHRLNKEMQLLATHAESQSYEELFKSKPAYYNSLLEKEGIALLIYESDTLKFWSDNAIAVENWIKEICLDTKITKLYNGWFEVMHPHSNATTYKTIVGMLLIKHEFPYQNKYLTNSFQRDFVVPLETGLVTNSPNSENSITNLDGEYLFSLNIGAEYTVTLINYIASLIDVLALLLLVFYLKKQVFSLNNLSKNYRVLLFAFLLILLRYTTIQFSLPFSFYHFDLFHPKIFADANSIWLSSLGDLLITVVLLFYLSFVAYNEFTISIAKKTTKLQQQLVLFLIALIYFLSSSIIHSLLTGLIQNSKISFAITLLFSLTVYSLVGIVIIALLLFIYFLISDKLIVFFNATIKDKAPAFVMLLTAFLLYGCVAYFVFHHDLITVSLPLFLIITIFLIRKKYQVYPFSGIIFLVFLFSLYTVNILLKYTQLKERESRKIYAAKIAEEQDPIAELLFQDIEKSIINDSVLSAYVSGDNKKSIEFEKRLRQRYFSDFWEKYDVHIALFDNACKPVTYSQNSVFDNNLYFDELIEARGRATASPHFYALNNTLGRISYIAKLPFYKTDKSLLGTLYLEFDGKYVSDEIGFPELLLDKSVGLSEELSNYSYAKYRNDKLISHYGKFQYNLVDTTYNTISANFIFLLQGGFDHLFYRHDPKTLVILSKPDNGWVGKITSFSYLFTFYSFLLLTLLLLKQLSINMLFERFTLRYRIQILLVFIILISLALFGGGTTYYIKQQFETKNRENISEKIHSVLMEIEGQMGTEKLLTTSLTEYTSFIIKKLAVVFYTDINLFDAHGNLYVSSRSKLFDEGLTSKKMNPEAYLQITLLGKTEFIHDERIGNLEYLSAYLPIKNKDGQLLAYLNLPYFAKQGELEKEISGFLVALINIYVLLFILSIVIAIFISNYVTKPLQLIQDKLRNIKLGKTNEPIDWKENDEIGSLVSEYNRMIAELTKSADLLAKSERENAWREMAKQVAHEIKNPLTPMKLSIQHLQRTWKDNSPEMDKKMEQVTKTIIDQIDSLSTIATAFSNFAEMPKTIFEEVNLYTILTNSISLFKDENHVQFELKTSIGDNAIVWADKEQLTRIFNNLIKNAIQAIPEERQGVITLLLKKQSDSYLIIVADNGTGISEEISNKIFVPNFTTKNGGMGLGLAMVKDLVEKMNGKIWFETTLGTGTQFFIMLPVYNSELTLLTTNV